MGFASKLTSVFVSELRKENKEKQEMEDLQQEAESLEFNNLSCITFPECVALVEEFLERLGMNDMTTRQEVDESIIWTIDLGEGLIPIYISLIDGDSISIIVRAILVQLPEVNREQMLLKCLQLNMEILECHFSVHEDIIMLEHKRHALGLDEPEIYRAFTSILAYANKYRDEFIDDYGAIKLI